MRPLLFPSQHTPPIAYEKLLSSLKQFWKDICKTVRLQEERISLMLTKKFALAY